MLFSAHISLYFRYADGFKPFSVAASASAAAAVAVCVTGIESRKKRRIGDNKHVLELSDINFPKKCSRCLSTVHSSADLHAKIRKTPNALIRTVTRTRVVHFI